ncbi:hypothetical protein RclHR1_21340001 [Rhizophagus clarus]|uniref:Uncharacterized protein n=1 Tax=Rhizophagus clarus TaxID=94130 RepID=A0A2Z6QSU7_9GLOM|nr:hypothetical protein RclHR1_21340001 [Rhizophagus clarus]GES88664.1 hypothetical protein GLOIN_2v1655940 [Rhizophagus clarus]
MFFIITFTNSVPLENKSISLKGETSIVKRQLAPPFFSLHAFFEKDFDPFAEVGEYVSGTFTFTLMPDGGIRVIGQCNTGFTDPDPSVYTIMIVSRPVCPTYIADLDLTPFLKYTINVPGTSGFQHDFYNKFTLEEIHHMFVVVKLGGTPIGAAYIEAVGED